MNQTSLIVLTALSVVAVGSNAQADVPERLHYQGYLTNAVGEPVHCADEASCPDGLLDMTFRLYDTAAGGAPLWEEPHGDVDVFEGRFHVVLGGDVPVTAGLLDAPTWLGVEIGTAGEMEPRQTVVSVPYALRSQSADELAGVPAGDFVTLTALPELCVSTEDLPAVLADLGVLPADAGSDTLASMSCEPSDLAVWSGVAWGCDDHLQEYTDHVAAFAAHGADPDAHHSANSEGIAIEPTSVAVNGGTTVLDEGSLDLGPGVHDELTAAMVTTLTGGGDADALHTHAGAAAGGGVCYTAWNAEECAESFQAVVVGEAYLPVARQLLNGVWGGAAPLLCIAGELNTYNGTNADAFLLRNSVTRSLQMNCAVCCR